MSKKILNKVNQYYSERVQEHGPTSKGVDWNGKASHFLRFDQLSKVIQEKTDFSILDYGCGYGSFIEYLNENKSIKYNYLGFDISEDMLVHAKQNYDEKHIHFINSLVNIKPVDYTIASGVFNVKLDSNQNDWEDYIKKTLKIIDGCSIKGFSFNILTSFSDESHKKDYLFYADPMYYFKYCKEHFSRNVALLHDYDLYEFTIIVRK